MQQASATGRAALFLAAGHLGNIPVVLLLPSVLVGDGEVAVLHASLLLRELGKGRCTERLDEAHHGPLPLPQWGICTGEIDHWG